MSERLIEATPFAFPHRAHYPGSAMIPAPKYLRSWLSLMLLGRPRHAHVMPIADDEGLGWLVGHNVNLMSTPSPTTRIGSGTDLIGRCCGA